MMLELQQDCNQTVQIYDMVYKQRKWTENYKVIFAL